MKRILISVGLLVVVVACARIQLGAQENETRTAVPTITLATETPVTLAAAASITPTLVAIRSESRARETLKDFMRARIERADAAVMESLTPELRANADTVLAQVPLLQVSNPCWYRFEILQFDEPAPSHAPAHAHAQIQMYEHFWSGDSGGGVPSSWTQTIALVETNSQWRVSALGKLEHQQDEPNEPHGQTLSACIAARTRTANSEQ